jgi:DNA helicase-2/ATP-dependent DNA helicase PcrA
VGDPDQSIYSWRHADPTNLHEFLRVWPDAKTVTLDQSYRSSQTILSAADAVISNNPGRLEKDLWTENGEGLPVAVAEAYDEDEEARLVLDEVQRLVERDGIPRREIAVMYRINAQSRAMEVACNRLGVPYRLVGGVKFYDRAEVRDVLAYLRLVSNPADDAALDRVINVPPRGISERTVAELRRVAVTKDMTMLDVVFAAQDEAGAGRGPLGLALQTRALSAVTAFGDLMKRLIEQSMVLQPAELVDLVLERTGYLQTLKDDEERGDERLENVRELRGTAEQFAGSQGVADPRENLAAFLENVALVSDVDEMERPEPAAPSSALKGGSDGEPITLITLHQAKGLEFDAVFIIGMEEGLLPHSRSLEDPSQLQEERRISYVGMTRARKRLYLLHAFQRSFRGSRMASVPSRFLAEIPPSLISVRAIRNLGRRGGTVPGPAAVKRAAAVPAPKVMSRPKLALSAGDRVRHELFGDGVVVSSKEDRGDVEVTVAFAGKGVKRLLLSFAPLEKVSVSRRDDSHNPLPEVADPDPGGP